MRIGLYIVNGPDYRVFVSSGLYDEIKRRGHSPVLLVEGLDRFKNVISFANHEVVDVSDKLHLSILSRLRYRLYQYRFRLWKLRADRLGIETIHFTGVIRNRNSIIQRLLPVDLLLTSIRVLYRILGYFSNNRLEFQLDVLMFESFQSTSAHALLEGAKKEGVKLVYLNSNWKDIFTNFEFPIIPETLIFWNSYLKKMSSTLTKEIDKKENKVLGNPLFIKMFNSIAKADSGAVRSKYNIPHSRKIALWCLSQEDFIRGEAHLVRKFDDALNRSGDNYQILLRKNPLNLNQDLSELIDLKRITILENYWRTDSHTDVAIQTQQGEIEWAALLKSSDLNIAGPSTVSLESAISHKPFICLLLDSNGNEDSRLVKYWNSALFRELKDCHSFNYLEILSYQDIDMIIKKSKSLNSLSMPKSDEFISSLYSSELHEFI